MAPLHKHNMRPALHQELHILPFPTQQLCREVDAHHAKTSTMLNPAGSLVFRAKLASCMRWQHWLLWQERGDWQEAYLLQGAAYVGKCPSLPQRVCLLLQDWSRRSELGVPACMSAIYARWNTHD